MLWVSVKTVGVLLQFCFRSPIVLNWLHLKRCDETLIGRSNHRVIVERYFGVVRIVCFFAYSCLLRFVFIVSLQQFDSCFKINWCIWFYCAQTDWLTSVVTENKMDFDSTAKWTHQTIISVMWAVLTQIRTELCSDRENSARQ